MSGDGSSTENEKARSPAATKAASPCWYDTSFHEVVQEEVFVAVAQESGAM